MSNAQFQFLPRTKDRYGYILMGERSCIKIYQFGYRKVDAECLDGLIIRLEGPREQ